jgi:hypothetical protein
MDLPKNERTFDLNAIGEVTQKEYDGQFTVLCVPSMRDRRDIEIEKGRLAADMSNPTDSLLGLAIILANIRIRILDAPNWWTQSMGGLDIQDENVLVALYEKVMEAEDLWRKDVKEKANPKKEEDSLGNVPPESKE